MTRSFLPRRPVGRAADPGRPAAANGVSRAWSWSPRKGGARRGHLSGSSKALADSPARARPIPRRLCAGPPTRVDTARGRICALCGAKPLPAEPRVTASSISSHITFHRRRAARLSRARISAGPRLERGAAGKAPAATTSTGRVLLLIDPRPARAGRRCATAWWRPPTAPRMLWRTRAPPASTSLPGARAGPIECRLRRRQAGWSATIPRRRA